MEELYGFGALGGASLILFLVAGGVSFIAWFYVSVCYMLIANKTGTRNSWLAFIPIVNLYLLCRAGGRPGWWFFAYFIPIPIVWLGVSIYIWMGIALERGKPDWVGALIAVPIANIIIISYLAFSE